MTICGIILTIIGMNVTISLPKFNIYMKSIYFLCFYGINILMLVQKMTKFSCLLFYNKQEVITC